MKAPRILHPLLLAAFPILFLYSQNADITPVKVVLPPLLLSVGAAGLVWLLLNLILADRLKSGLATTVLLVLFFAYGHTRTTVEERLLDGETSRALSANLDLYLSAIFLLAAASAMFLLSRTRRDLTGITRAANVAVLALVVLQAPGLAQSLRSPGVDRDREQMGASAPRGVPGEAPDIYYIILDGYARADTLRNYYGFDNGGFTKSLEERGFWIAPRSTSNYYWTFLSLASSLNMEHVTYLRDLNGETSMDRYLAYQAVKNNAVARFLRSKGYTTIHFASTWGATLENPFADETIKCRAGPFQTEFYRVLAETTWLGVYRSEVSTDLAQCHLSNFAMLADIASRRGPKFVFAHFIPPHHPYLFDRHGNVLRKATVTNQFEMQEKLWERKADYVDQLMFINRKVVEAVDGILASSAKPPIIIIQSDHGPHVPRAGSRVHRLRFANLAAFHFPDRARFIPDTVTSVNVFPLIFNHYFAAGLPLLEDRHFHSTYGRPYAFREIFFERQ